MSLESINVTLDKGLKWRHGCIVFCWIFQEVVVRVETIHGFSDDCNRFHPWDGTENGLVANIRIEQIFWSTLARDETPVLHQRLSVKLVEEGSSRTRHLDLATNLIPFPVLESFGVEKDQFFFPSWNDLWMRVQRLKEPRGARLFLTQNQKGHLSSPISFRNHPVINTSEVTVLFDVARNFVVIFGKVLWLKASASRRLMQRCLVFRHWLLFRPLPSRVIPHHTLVATLRLRFSP
mmetsp:Transcript_9225/g.19888  ORF Transcript_9225/g.19888 Transcript_9225/m.19888 type:complete len:235 (-) Transcript_9225:290-994(-)